MIFLGDYFYNVTKCVAVVVEYTNKNNIVVEFNDDPNQRITTTARALVSGRFRNPYYRRAGEQGYTGVGDFNISEKGNLTAVYKDWVKLFDNKVDPEWHNFQNFAQWRTTQPGHEEGWVLNKDLLYPGNRVYSPVACMLIPKQFDSILSYENKSKNKLPPGVSRCGKKYQVHFMALRTPGVFETPEEAFQDYKSKKEAFIKELVETKYMFMLPGKTRNALLAYRVVR